MLESHFPVNQSRKKTNKCSDICLLFEYIFMEVDVVCDGYVTL